MYNGMSRIFSLAVILVLSSCASVKNTTVGDFFSEKSKKSGDAWYRVDNAFHTIFTNSPKIGEYGNLENDLELLSTGNCYGARGESIESRHCESLLNLYRSKDIYLDQVDYLNSLKREDTKKSCSWRSENRKIAVREFSKVEDFNGCLSLLESMYLYKARLAKVAMQGLGNDLLNLMPETKESLLAFTNTRDIKKSIEVLNASRREVEVKSKKLKGDESTCKEFKGHKDGLVDEILNIKLNIMDKAMSGKRFSSKDKKEIDARVKLLQDKLTKLYDNPKYKGIVCSH